MNPTGTAHRGQSTAKEQPKNSQRTAKEQSGGHIQRLGKRAASCYSMRCWQGGLACPVTKAATATGAAAQLTSRRRPAAFDRPGSCLAPSWQLPAPSGTPGQSTAWPGACTRNQTGPKKGCPMYNWWSALAATWPAPQGTWGTWGAWGAWGIVS